MATESTESTDPHTPCYLAPTPTTPIALCRRWSAPRTRSYRGACETRYKNTKKGVVGFSVGSVDSVAMCGEAEGHASVEPSPEKSQRSRARQRQNARSVPNVLRIGYSSAPSSRLSNTFQFSNPSSDRGSSRVNASRPSGWSVRTTMVPAGISRLAMR